MWWAALCAAALAADHRPHHALRGRHHEDVDEADLQHLSDATEGDDLERADEEPDTYPDELRDDEGEGDEEGSSQMLQSLQQQVSKLTGRLEAGLDTKRVDNLETEVGELQSELAEEKAEQARTEANVLSAVSRNLKPIVHKMVVAVSHVVAREKVLEQKVASAALQQADAQAQSRTATAQAEAAASQASRSAVASAWTNKDAPASAKLSSQVAEVLKPELERVLEGKLETDVQEALRSELDREVQSLGNASAPVVQQLNFAAQLAGVVERNVEQNVSARLRFVRKPHAERRLAEPEQAPRDPALSDSAPDAKLGEILAAGRELRQADEARVRGAGFAAPAAAAPAPEPIITLPIHEEPLHPASLAQTRARSLAFEQVQTTTHVGHVEAHEAEPTPADIQAALDDTEGAGGLSPEGLASLIKASVTPAKSKSEEPEPELEPEPQAAEPQAAEPPAAEPQAEPAVAPAAEPQSEAEPAVAPAAEPQSEAEPAAEPLAERAAEPRAGSAAPHSLVEQRRTVAESNSDFSGAFCSMCGQHCPYAICHS